ncbi:MAG: LptA/OstA family protein [Desulfobacterales bacterium]
MRIISHANSGKKRLFVCALPVLIMLLLLAGTQDAAAAPETIDPNDTNHENNHIRITADKLVATVDAAEIEFIGTVKTIREDAVITSDRLKIIYDPDAIKKSARGSQKETIKKIIATGHVKIVTDDIIAETDRAEYTIKSKILVLRGDQSRVSQGGHSITGAKFTLYRSEGKLSVESKGKNRIRAIVQP